MRLESVLALKAELFDLPASFTEAVGHSRSFVTFASRRVAVDRAVGGIALGVDRRNRNQFRLAVRLQQTGPLVSAVVEQIRDRAKGEADVRFVGNIAKFAKAAASSAGFYRRRRRPLRIGSSISDVQDGFVSAGTLGCFVIGRQSPHYLGMLTNNHVIASENENESGDPVVQPGTLDGGSHPADEVGELGRYVRLKRRGANYVDAAIGDIYEGVDYDPLTIGTLGDLSGQADVATLPANAELFKVGRTTGQTTGRLTAFALDNVQVQYDMGVLRFDNQIEIEGAGNAAFSDSGDSGSLIVDSDCRAIGLLFAGGDQGGSNGKGLTYANPIGSVLDALRVDLDL